MKDRILVLAPIPEETLDELRDDFELVSAGNDPLAFFDAHPEVASIEIAFTIGNGALTQEMIERLPSLDYVCHFGVGCDGIDREMLRQRGIRFTSTVGSNASCVADYAMLLLGTCVRRLRVADAYVRTGGWASGAATLPRTPHLAGRKVGIYGLGEIGSRIARRAEAFEMEVGYYARSPKPHVPQRYFPTLLSLACWCDDLVISVPANADTIGSVNRHILDALGPDGNLINIARGAIVIEDDLIAALSEQRIAGAGLDVFDREPAVHSGLLGLPNVVLSPHVAANTHRSARQTSEIFLANLRSYLAARPNVPHRR